MKYYLISPYRDIPIYSEVEVIDWGYDSGYSICNVKYLGKDYKPLVSDIKSAAAIEEGLKYAEIQYKVMSALFNNTIGAKK